MADSQTPHQKSVKVTNTEYLSYKPYKFLLIVSSFMISISINTGFYIINLSAQDSAQYFKKQDYTATFGLVLMVCATLSTIIVSRCFSKTKHSTKIYLSTLIRTSAFFILFIAFYIDNLEVGFWLNIFASGCFGSFSSVDHTVFVGFIKAFPSYCYTGYVSGVGFAGLLSVIFYFGCRNLGLNLGQISLIMVPLNFVVIVLFIWMVTLKERISSSAGMVSIATKNSRELENEYLLNIEISKEKSL